MRRLLLSLGTLAALLIVATPAWAIAYSHFSVVSLDIVFVPNNPPPGVTSILVPNGHTLVFDLPQSPAPDFVSTDTFGFYNVAVVEDGVARIASVVAFGTDDSFFFAGGLPGSNRWTLYQGGLLYSGSPSAPTFLDLTRIFNIDLETIAARMTITSSNVVPEPASLALLGAGLLGLLALRPRRRRLAMARARL